MKMPQLHVTRLAPLTGTTKKLVILLHGYGADGEDLVSLGREWQRSLPDTEFVAPNAPQLCENAPMGYQWFPLNVAMQGGVVSTPEERWQGASQAAPIIDAFVDAELARTGLEASSLALVGFSQGAMMALHVGLRRVAAPAMIVSFSGMLLGPEYMGSITAKPPVFLAHGSMDDVVPVEALIMAQQVLAAAGVDVTSSMQQGIGHGIDSEALRRAGAFLVKNFR